MRNAAYSEEIVMITPLWTLSFIISHIDYGQCEMRPIRAQT